MPSDLLTKRAGQIGAPSKTAIGLHNDVRNLTSDLKVATASGDAAKVKELEQKIRDAQDNAVKATADQFLKGADKKRFDLSLETARIIRDRLANDKSFLPGWEELTTDPTTDPAATHKTPLQMLSGNFGQLGAIANAAGIGKEFGALNAAIQIADVVDRYGLGDGRLKDFLGTDAQLKDLAEKIKNGDLDGDLDLAKMGVGLDNLQAGLGMFAALGGMFGFGKDIAKVQKAVSALQGIQKALSGDLAGGIDGLLALDGLLFTLPPTAKEALNKAKELAKGMERFKKITPIPPGAAGVFVETHEIAALGLSGTVHGIPLSPGTGSPTVKAFGAPVWRTNSDLHVCMLPGALAAPHMPPPGGMVPKGATKTYADKILIARHQDSTLEANGGGLVQIIPLPEAMAIAKKRAAEEAEKKRKEQEKKAAEKAAKEKAAREAAARQKAQQQAVQNPGLNPDSPTVNPNSPVGTGPDPSGPPVPGDVQPTEPPASNGNPASPPPVEPTENPYQTQMRDAEQQAADYARAHANDAPAAPSVSGPQCTVDKPSLATSCFTGAVVGAVTTSETGPGAIAGAAAGCAINMTANMMGQATTCYTGSPLAGAVVSNVASVGLGVANVAVKGGVAAVNAAVVVEQAGQNAASSTLGNIMDINQNASKR